MSDSPLSNYENGDLANGHDDSNKVENSKKQPKFVLNIQSQMPRHRRNASPHSEQIDPPVILGPDVFQLDLRE